VSTSSKAALQHVQTKKEEVDAAAEQLLQSRQLKDDERTPAVDPKAAAVVERASDELKTKPESSFTAEDHFARGLSQFAKGNHLSALESFRLTSQAVLESTPADALARYLIAQGVTFGILGKSEEAIAVYDEIDRRFGKDESPGVREQVVRGLVNKGGMLARLDKPKEAIAVYDEMDQRFGKDESPRVREQVARGLLSKGITFGKLDKREEEIAVYDEMDKRFGRDESPGVREQVAGGLFSKGITFGKLDKREEEIAVYVEIDRRFGKDESRGVRERVAKARNGLAFGRIISAKQHWQDVPRKTELLAAAIKGLESALLICANDDRAIDLGNLGYALFLSGDFAAAVDPTRDCLKLGGELTHAGQQNDAKQHRVEPEDSEYEALLTRLWAELHPASGLSGARPQEDS
jgi:tetratricopeptide (TPR) repeat protein